METAPTVVAKVGLLKVVRCQQTDHNFQVFKACEDVARYPQHVLLHEQFMLVFTDAI